VEDNDIDQASSLHLRKIKNKIKNSERTEIDCHCCYADMSRNCQSENTETKKDQLEEKEQISGENAIKTFTKEKKWIFDKGGFVIEGDNQIKQKSDFPNKMELESKMEKSFSENSKLEKEIRNEWNSSSNPVTCEHQNFKNGKRKNFQNFKRNQIEFETQRNVDEINSLRNKISNEENNFHSDFPNYFHSDLECYSNVKLMDQVVVDDDDQKSLKELQMSNENENRHDLQDVNHDEFKEWKGFESDSKTGFENQSISGFEGEPKTSFENESKEGFVYESRNGFENESKVMSKQKSNFLTEKLVSAKYLTEEPNPNSKKNRDQDNREVTNEELDKCNKIEVVPENRDVTHVTTRHHSSAIQPKKVALPGQPNQVEEAHQSQILFNTRVIKYANKFW